MKFTLPLFILLLNYTFVIAQSELAKKGTITLADNQKIVFNNLKLINGKFSFTDVASGSEKELAIKEIKYVEDDKMSRIFTNKSIETADDVKKATEDKQHAIEEKEKKEMNEKLRIMREEAGSLKLRRNGI